MTREIDNFHRIKQSPYSIGRRPFAVGLIAASLVGVFDPWLYHIAFAEPTSAEKQAEADEVKKRLDGWAVELDQATSAYYEVMEAHDAAVVSMEEAQSRIDACESEVTRLQGQLGSRATTMYKQGQFSFFEVLFGAHSFSEFTTSWDLLNNINNEDATLIERSKRAQHDAQAARDDYSAQEKLAAQKLNEADEIKAKAEQTVASYEIELASLEVEIAELVEKEREEEQRRQQEASRQQVPNSNNPAYIPPPGLGSVVAYAQSQLGVPYVWGAASPGVGFDCSGLTMWCYAQVGISLPHYDGGQYSAATARLPVSEAAAGDILWMSGHVGIYVGGGSYIHAPTSGQVVSYGSNMGMWSAALRF